MIELSGTITYDGLTKHGKKLVAISMFEKGTSFFAAAMLLRKNGGHEAVVLHLICQGLENILKSILLLEDFDKYRKFMRKNIGHNLEKAVNEVNKIKGSRDISVELNNEIAKINHFYKKHFLRYGGLTAMLAHPHSSDSELVVKKLFQLIKIMRYKLARAESI